MGAASEDADAGIAGVLAEWQGTSPLESGNAGLAIATGPSWTCAIESDAMAGADPLMTKPRLITVRSRMGQIAMAALYRLEQGWRVNAS